MLEINPCFLRCDFYPTLDKYFPVTYLLHTDMSLFQGIFPETNFPRPSQKVSIQFILHK